MKQYATVGDTVYFWFAANDTSGSGGDGASAAADIRLAGAAANAAPVYSPTPSLLSHANYPAGAHEIAIAASVGNGFAANNTYAVFCTLLVDSQNPTGFVGSFDLKPIESNLLQIGDAAQSATDLKDFADAGYDPSAHKIETCKVNDDMVGTASAALASVCTETRLARLDAAITTRSSHNAAAIWSAGSRALSTPADYKADISAIALEATLTAMKGGTFSGATDSLEAIRDRGDASWVTGAGGSDRLLMVDTTIATLASQTSFTLTAGSVDDNAYNNCTIVIEDASTATQKAVGIISDYVGSTKTVTLKYDPSIFTMAATDKVYILAENALKATLANRQLNVAADGDIAGNVDGSVASLVGHTVQTGDNYARLGAPAGASLSADLLAIDNYVDELESRLTATRAGYIDNLSVGAAALEATLSDIKGTGFVKDTHSLPQCLTAAGFSTHTAADIWSVVTRALTDKAGFALSSAAISAIWNKDISAYEGAGYAGTYLKTLYDDWLNGGRLDLILDAIAADVVNLDGDAMRGTDSAALASICTETRLAELAAANLPTDIDAILADTGTDGVVVAPGSKTGYTLSTAGVDAILDEVVEGTTTFRQMLRIFMSALSGKSAGGGTVTLTFRDVADAKDRITATVDENGNRTTMVLDGT